MRHNIIELQKNSTAILKKTAIIAVFVFFFASSGDIAFTQSAHKKDVSAKTKTEEKAKQVQKDSAEEEVPGITEKEYTENDFKPQLEEESYAWLVFKTMLIMGLLIGGFYYFFRYVTKKTGMQILGQNVVNVLSVVPIGQNKYLQIVDLAGKVIVLGVSDSTISLITEITDKDEISRIRIQSQKNPAPGSGGFQDYLSRNIGKLLDKVSEIKNRKKGHDDSHFFESGHGFDNLKEHQKRLKKLNGYDQE